MGIKVSDRYKRFQDALRCLCYIQVMLFGSSLRRPAVLLNKRINRNLKKCRGAQAISKRLRVCMKRQITVLRSQFLVIFC